jgi:hypothetical protein
MFSHWRLARATIALLALIILLAPVARADEAQTKAAIAKLLEVGWGVTPQARAAADLQYQEVLRVAGGDPRALKASWLVLMQQRRFEDARKRLDEYLAARPDDLEAVRAKTWVLAISKNYPGAMLSADRLSGQLAAKPAEGGADSRTEEDELIGFLGRMLGYLGGPVADSVSQEDRKAIEKKLLGRLDESRRAVFEDARNGVLDRFIEMSDDSAEAQDRAVAAARAQKEKTLAELAADREEAAARAKELDERRKKAREEFQKELDKIARQDQPLREELARLTTRASNLTNDLLVYASEISRLQQLAASEMDPGRRQFLLLEADRLGLYAGRIEADLLGVNQLAQSVQAQRAGLANRQAQTQANSASQVERIDQELGDIAKREKRNEGIEKRAIRATATTTSRVRSLSAQATALSTYDSFPLEAAKMKLLESLR